MAGGGAGRGQGGRGGIRCCRRGGPRRRKRWRSSVTPAERVCVCVCVSTLRTGLTTKKRTAETGIEPGPHTTTWEALQPQLWFLTATKFVKLNVFIISHIVNGKPGGARLLSSLPPSSIPAPATHHRRRDTHTGGAPYYFSVPSPPVASLSSVLLLL